MIAAAPDLERLIRREHGDPHSVLGAHAHNGGVVVRALRPAAAHVKVHATGGKDVELEQVHPGGVFEGVVEGVTVSGEELVTTRAAFAVLSIATYVIPAATSAATSATKIRVVTMARI